MTSAHLHKDHQGAEPPYMYLPTNFDRTAWNPSKVGIMKNFFDPTHAPRVYIDGLLKYMQKYCCKKVHADTCFYRGKNDKGIIIAEVTVDVFGIATTNKGLNMQLNRDLLPKCKVKNLRQTKKTIGWTVHCEENMGAIHISQPDSIQTSFGYMSVGL